MDGQFEYSRNVKRIGILTTIVGIAFVASLQKFGGDAAEGCKLPNGLKGLNGAAWVLLEALHAVIQAGGQSVQAYLCENASFLVHLPPILVSIWPLLRVVVG